MPQIYFLSFGGGGQNYRDAVKRLCKQASEFEIFNKIYCFTDEDLPIQFPDFGKNIRIL